MSWFGRNRESTVILAVFVVVLASLLALGIFKSKYGSSPSLESIFENTTRKIELIQTMRINLLASAEAEKRAVMADTDEMSKAFAEQAIQLSAAVEEARTEFARLLETRSTHNELSLFKELNDCWEKHQEIDRVLLPLAVQNTNLKALRLSFVPAKDALTRMEAALNRLTSESGSSPKACAITRLSSEALAGALKIHTLQAPHIIESTDTRMNEIESHMKTLDEQVRDGLSQLEIFAEETSRHIVDEATGSYLDFRKINEEIILLSRRNSNIQSFAISLDQKRKLTAQCLETMTVIHEAVQTSLSTGTK